MTRLFSGVALVVFGAIVATCMQRKDSKMLELPADIKEYLSAGDGLGRKAAEANHPGLQKKLESAETRAAILKYLASDDPWHESNPGIVINALGLIQKGASASEIPLVRPLVLHPEGMVRLGAYDFLFAVYYPAGDRASMINLLQSMLLDSHDMVRSQAAQYVKGLKVPAELKPFLERWIKLAPARGWQKQESFELIERLLKP